MHRVFRSYIEGIRESSDPDALRAVVSQAIAAFELRTFTYFSPHGSRNSSIFISTYPTSWTDHYFAQGYDGIDPVFSIAHATQQPFHWGKDVAAVDLASPQKRMFDEAASFGIRNGLTFPLACGSASFAAMTIVADEKPSAFQRKVDKTERLLQFMAIALHVAVRRKRWLTGLVDGVALTQREMECLHWTAQGKSAGDIGCILAIRRSTVSFHLENAKFKLGVRTLAQAVARFVAGE